MNVKVDTCGRLLKASFLLLIVFLASCEQPVPGISGTPKTTAPIDAVYSFKPTITKLGNPVFQIENKPIWASFDVSNGTLTGTPRESDVGAYDGIVISVSAIPEGGSESQIYSLPSFNITVPPLVVDKSIVITPSTTQGAAPLKVLFNADAADAGIIDQFRWDVGNDGKFEKQSAILTPYAYEFSAPGVYQVQLSGISPSGSVLKSNIVTVTVTGTVQPENLVYQLVSSHYVAKTTDTIYFIVVPSNTSTETVLLNAVDTEKVEWDFDGNGVVDKTSMRGATGLILAGLTTTTLQEGTYVPKAKIFLANGKTYDAQMEDAEVVVKDGNAFFVSVYDDQGVVTRESYYYDKLPKTFEAQISGISPENIGSIEWDLDIDGNVEGTNSIFSLTLPDCNKHALGVKVTSVSGEVADNKIFVVPPDGFQLKLELDNGGIVDLEKGLQAKVSLTQECSFPYTLFVEDYAGNKVKVLKALNQAAAPAGVPQIFTWDGKNESGQIVPDGVYLAIIEYQNGLTMERYSPQGTGSGSVGEINDQRLSPISATTSNGSFNAFYNDPLELQFTLTEPTVVSAFVGVSSLGAKVQNLINGKYLSAGKHTIYWHATTEDGQFLELTSDSNPQVGIWALDPKNLQLVVINRPNLSKVTTSPTIFNPISGAYAGQDGKTHLQFNLDRTADIELTVRNADSGRIVYQQTFVGRSQGGVDLTCNGRDSNGVLVISGKYHYKVVAKTQSGDSIPQFALQQITY